jgi:hypothetical protein
MTDAPVIALNVLVLAFMNNYATRGAICFTRKLLAMYAGNWGTP